MGQGSGSVASAGSPAAGGGLPWLMAVVFSAARLDRQGVRTYSGRLQGGTLSMPNAPSNDTVRRLQALIERETGAPLGASVQAEMAAILGGGPAAARPVAPEVAQVAQREVTIVLADLRGFTALSATRPAGEVVMALNRCLARLSEVVYRYQGTIDKFTGESIMVLFGAPQSHADDV